MKRTLGQRLKEARESCEWTQPELARKSGVSTMTISHFECNRREPRIANLVRLADALGVTTDWLILGLRKSK